MSKRTPVLVAACAAALATMAQCSGGSSAPTRTAEIQVSSSSVAPGQELVISHPSFTVGSTVQVSLSGAQGHAITLALPVWEAGRARLFVPALVDFAAGSAAQAFTPGDVTVSMFGLPGSKAVHVAGLPASPGGTPGSYLSALATASADLARASRQSYAATAVRHGVDAAALLSRLDREIASLDAMSAELTAKQQLTVATTDGRYVLAGEDLAVAERFAYAAISGIGASLGIGPGPSALRTPASRAQVIPTTPAEAIRPTLEGLRSSVPALQTFGSWVAATTAWATVAFLPPGLIMSPWTSGASLAPAAYTAVVSAGAVAVTTIAAAVIAGGTTFGLQIIDGQTWDAAAYVAAADALKVTEQGLVAMAVTTMAAGFKLAELLEHAAEAAALAYESSSFVKHVRGVVCGEESGSLLWTGGLAVRSVATATQRAFCDGTSGCCVLPSLPPSLGGRTGGGDPCDVAGTWTMTCPDEVCASGDGGYPAATGGFTITAAVAAEGGATTPGVGFVGFIGVFDVSRCALVLDFANLGSALPPDNKCPLPPASSITLRNGYGTGRIPFQEWDETACRCSELLPLPCTFARR